MIVHILHYFPMPSHFHYVTYCFNSNVTSQSYSTAKELLLYSLLRKVLAHYYQLYMSNVYSSQIFTKYKRRENES